MIVKYSLVNSVITPTQILQINRKSAVIRHMFFNREDILWFKPVELRTKWGRRGHIKEALGELAGIFCHNITFYSIRT